VVGIYALQFIPFTWALIPSKWAFMAGIRALQLTALMSSSRVLSDSVRLLREGQQKRLRFSAVAAEKRPVALRMNL